MATPLKIVGSDKKNGALSSVTLQLLDPKDISIYTKFFEDENITCPFCGKSVEIDPNNVCLRIDSPLSDPLNMCLSTPIVTCENCNNTLPTSMMDYRAFNVVSEFITALRNRANSMKEEKHG